jgi:transposase-like protein
MSAAFTSGAIVTQVARQNGAAEGSLYAWRKQFGKSRPDNVGPDRPQLMQ